MRSADIHHIDDISLLRAMLIEQQMRFDATLFERDAQLIERD